MIFLFFLFLATFLSIFFLLEKSHSYKEKQTDPLFKVIQKISVLKAFQEKQVFQEKQKICRERAPQMLDILTLGLSAGLSFDSALDLYLCRTENVLSQELFQTQMLWRLGEESRAQALEKLAKKLDISVIRRFSAAVSEALLFGVPLAHTLISQAKDIRQEQKAEIEEAIEKVPVKLLIPLGTLVVPAMLLAIIGPLLAGAFM